MFILFELHVVLINESYFKSSTTWIINTRLLRLRTQISLVWIISAWLRSMVVILGPFYQNISYLSSYYPYGYFVFTQFIAYYSDHHVSSQTFVSFFFCTKNPNIFTIPLSLLMEKNTCLILVGMRLYNLIAHYV